TGAIQVGESAAIVAGAIQALGRMIVAGTLTVGDGSGAPAVLAARNGGGVRASTLIMQGGSVTADAYSAVIVNSITAAPRAGRIRVEAGAVLSGWGSVGGYNAGYLDNAGTVIATGGTLAVNVFDNTGTLAIAADGVLRIDPVLGALGGTTRFLGATGALQLQINPSGTATLETLADFVPGDVVAMTGLNEPVLQPTFDPTTSALSINVAISGENASPRTNQALTITLAETPADRVFFVLPGAGHTSVLYTAVGSLTGQDAGAGTGQARVLTWNPRLSGDWNTGGNWFDTTTAVSQTPTAAVGPGTLDTVNLLGPYGLGTLFDVVSGNGNAAAVNVTGAVAVSGTVTTGTLAVGAPDQATTLALIGSGRVQAGAATIGATLDLTAGTTLTADGTIAIAQLTGTSGTVAVAGGALMQSPTLLVDTPNLRSLGIA
ncbi:MAG: hypothetical protein J0H35_09530, partial [Rhodospirillales bacterium]|nr:hypothetical protein [Rhodospirillales bacterium]